MFDLPWKLRAGPAAFLIATLLSACGGGTPDAPVGPPVPSAQADIAAAMLNTSITLSVLANDSGTNGGVLKLVSVTAPAHGTATISGDKIVYVPSTGFIGKDSFSYTAKDAGSGTLTSTAEVAVTVSAALTLSGKTVDIPGNARVSIAIGTKTVASSTDASGNFSAPVMLDTPENLITITAQGSGDKAFIKLISLVGDSQQAVNAAAGTIVSADKLPGLNVNSLTTAVYAHTILKNAGAVPTTRDALDDASARIPVGEMMQTAAMLRSLTGKAGAKPLRTLPSNITDTLALVTNRQAYTLFVKTTSEATFSDEMDALAADSTLGSVPLVSPTASKSLNFFINGGCCSLPAMEMVLNPDGSGSFMRDQNRIAGTWRKDSVLTMELAQPYSRFDLVMLPNFVEAEVQHITYSVTLRQYSGTAQHGFANITYTGVDHYPHGELPDAPYSTSQVLAFSDWESMTAPGDLSGATLAGVPDVAFSPAFSVPQLIVSLAAGGGVSSPQFPGLTFGWNIQAGKLVLALNGAQTLTLGRVWASANGEEHWLVRTSPGADYALYEAMTVRPQKGLAFTETNAVQRWLSSPLSNFIGTQSIVKVLADHTSGTEAVQMDGTVLPFGATSWKIEDGKLAMRSYRTPTGSLVSVCPEGVTCFLASERIWTLLSSDASSIVVLEFYWVDPADIRQRIVRYGRT